MTDLSPEAVAAYAAAHGIDTRRAASRMLLDGLAQKRGEWVGDGIAARKWRSLSPALRWCLLLQCTAADDPARLADAQWHALTPEQRTQVGAAARQWRRELEAAGLLR